MSDLESHTEDPLAAFKAGDETAVSDLLDRFGDGVYSYFLARTGEQDSAVDATVETFAAASSSAETTYTDPKVLLFSTARRVAREKGMTFAPPPDDEEMDLRERVLRSVAGLGVRDRDLMTLESVGRLDDHEISQVVGLDEGHADEVLARTRRRVAGALGPLLVARFGTEECADLRSMRGDWNGTFSDADRAMVSRHLASCDVCSRARTDLLTSNTVLSALLTVAMPASARESILAAVVVAPEPEPVIAEPEPVPEPAAPPVTEPIAPAVAGLDETDVQHTALVPEGPRDRRDLAMLGVFALVAVVIGLVGFLVAGRFEPLDRPVTTTFATIPAPDDRGSTSSTSSTTTNTSPPGATQSTQTGTAGPATFTAAVASVDFGADATTGRLDITNSGGQAAEARITSSSAAVLLAADTVELGPGETVSFEVGLDRDAVEEGEISEVLTISWQGGSTEVSVTGSQLDNPIIHNPRASPATIQARGDGCDNTHTTVSARITDTSPFEAVVRWSAGGGGTEETAMTGIGGDVYEAVIGPFTAAQTASARVIAIDELDNAGGATVIIEVEPCN